MTVSRVLSGRGYSSADARDRVLASIRRLGYRPNAIARSLRQRATKVIGVLLGDTANPFSSELVQGIESVLREAGYSCFLSAPLRDVERETNALAAFLDHQADGLLVATRETAAGNDALAAAAERGTPIVAVGRRISHPAIDRVSANHRLGAFEAVSHLVSLGHQAIGFIGAAPGQGHSLQRFQGYLDALEAHGLTPREEWITGPGVDTPAYSTQDDGYAGLRALFAAPARPTAVLCRNDATAIGAIGAALDLGCSVPADLAIAGFDNIPLSAYTQPPLTTVEQPTVAQGRLAANLLLERLSGQYSGPAREEILPCRLIVRKSCGSSTRQGASFHA